MLGWWIFFDLRKRGKMKSWIMCFLVLSTVYGQSAHPQAKAASQGTPQASEEQAVLVKFANARNVFYTRTFFNAGTIQAEWGQSIAISGLFISRPLTGNSSAAGVQITVNSHDRFSDTLSKTVDHVSYIDDDEIENLNKALSYMKDVAQKWSASAPPQYTEMTFSGRSDFQCGLFYSDKEGPLFFVLASPDQRDMVSISWQQIDTFAQMVNSAASSARAELSAKK